MIKDQIEKDLKQALLARETLKANTLKSLKNVIRNAEIDTRKDVSDEDATKLIAKQLKQREEAAALYTQGGSEERAANEKAEAEIIKQYLPEPLNEAEIKEMIHNLMTEQNLDQMGSIIGAVNKQAGGRADGATVARLVKEALGL